MRASVCVIITECTSQCVFVCSLFKASKSDWYPVCPRISICLCVRSGCVGRHLRAACVSVCLRVHVNISFHGYLKSTQAFERGCFYASVQRYQWWCARLLKIVIYYSCTSAPFCAWVCACSKRVSLWVVLFFLSSSRSLKIALQENN